MKDDLVKNIRQGDTVSIAAASFSMYAFQELQEQFDSLDEFRFIFTSQTFTKQKAPKEKREYYIPRLNREKSLFGTDLEIRLRNELTQKAIAKECAEWIKKKATFKSFEDGGSFSLPMFAIWQDDDAIAYIPFQDFTTSQLGVERSDSAFGSSVSRQNTRIVSPMLV